MASVWQKTLFYLGLVDDEQIEAAEEASTKAPQAQVRTVERPRPITQTSEPLPPAPAVSTSTQPPTQGQVAGRRIEPPSQQRRRISGNPEHAEAGVLVRAGGPSEGGTGDVGRPLGYDVGGGEAEIIVARTFTDAQTLADHLRNNRPVVLDLRNAEAAMVRRLVDFASGLTYGLGGRMVKTAQGVILVTPPTVTIGMEERTRLASLGLYTVPLEG